MRALMLLRRSIYLSSSATATVYARYLSSATSACQVTKPRPASEIPGPKSYIPFLGNFMTLALRKDFDANKLDVFWKNLVSEHGPIFRIDIPGQGPGVAITDPDDIEVMFRSTLNNPDRIIFESIKKVRYEEPTNYFNQKSGLLPENGEEWWRLRSRMQTPMLKPKNVAMYLEQMDQVALDFMDRIEVLRTQHGEMPEDFLEELYKWALESIATVALNRRLGCLNTGISEDSEPIRIIKAVNNMFKTLNDVEVGFHLWRFFPTPSFKKLVKAHGVFLQIVDKNIRETESKLKHRKEEDELSLMEQLLNTPGLARSDVVTMILDMIFAGIDTNPSAQETLHKEIDQVLGDQDRPLTANDLTHMSYLKAVVKETMRLYPIVIGTARKLSDDVVIKGYHIPKGWVIFALTYLASRDEKNFTRASEFLPERWLRNRPFGPIHPFSSLPFSHGSRMCIGRRFAEQELYIFLARAMQRYNLEYRHKDISTLTRLVLMPSEPLKFNFTPRG